MGVMADLSGDRDPEKKISTLRRRKFIEVDRDNFDAVLESIEPRLALRLENRLTKNEGETVSMVLNFKTIEDFEPIPVIKQVPAMNALYEKRTYLRDMLNKLDGNDALEGLLTLLVRDKTKRVEVLKALKANSSDKS